jgi:hypothetical protein
VSLFFQSFISVHVLNIYTYLEHFVVTRQKTHVNTPNSGTSLLAWRNWYMARTRLSCYSSKRPSFMSIHVLNIFTYLEHFVVTRLKEAMVIRPTGARHLAWRNWCMARTRLCLAILPKGQVSCQFMYPIYLHMWNTLL